ncbi:methionine ABC transporter ATP-binding protein [Uliginosibacterium sp. H1]|uniref:methionine ABC transporter ATP-binding protein n=1 Tax=Uliginosibacterium sp. H1 TaxID=3114757 RepID=UPI002E196AE8|nr:methionine ABC transporter ATP-binding protein [Uliginosibacterium sp. H1]
MIELTNVSQHYIDGQGSLTHAVRDVSLQISAGEIFGIIGRSGAGKSTLVRSLNLLHRPSSGTVRVAGRELTALSPEALREARHEIGMIFQHFNLLSSRTVYGNVALPLELAGQSRTQIREAVEPLLELVGLAAQRDRYPSQLSGGQKQRVGIARALASRPKVLLSDEATSALDPETTRAILDLLRKINRELGLTIVLITHQMQVVKQICDRVAVMDAGRIVELGSVLDVFRQPQQDVTRALIGDVIAHELPSGILERLRRQDVGAARLLRLAFVGDEVDRPLLSEAVRRFDLDFSILHGQVDEVQGQPFGSLTILTRASQATIAEASAFLAEHGVTTEDLTAQLLPAASTTGSPHLTLLRGDAVPLATEALNRVA